MQAFMLLSRSASSKRLTGGSLLSSRVSAGASFAPSAASAAAALSALSPVQADSASATASERSRACGFLTVTDRKSVVSGKRVYVSVDIGGRRILKKQYKQSTTKHPI